MNGISNIRTDIYDYFRSSEACQKYFFAPENNSKNVAYYNSMFLIQDSTESLLTHRARGFSKDEKLQAYIEFWGVLQAVIIQQDAIDELWESVVGQRFDAKTYGLKAWFEIRDLRNACGGHPAKKDRPRNEPVERSFMGRDFGDYDRIVYERWREDSGRTYPKIKLGELIDAYAKEAESQLANVLTQMQNRWPLIEPI